jgi:hypothetical protein
MTVNLNNLRPLIQRETVKAIREILESRLTEDDAERRRQERLAATIDKKNLNAEDGNKASKDVDEVEEEEDEAEEEVQDTGVPTPGNAPQQDRSGGKGTADSPKLDTPTLKQIEKPTPNAVIDKLNALRGGKSLKDAGIRKSFEQYFKALGQDEKESLLIYLTAIAQILAGVTTGADAIDPSDVGIQTKEPENVHAKHIAKTRTAPSSGKEPLPGSEATPIVVGEHQHKQGVMKILEAYKQFS